MYRNTLYHQCLRVSIVLCALVLVFQSNIIPLTGFSTLSRIRSDMRMYEANVIGISAGVAPTELSTITAGLTKRSTELDQREAALREREINARAVDTSTSFGLSDYVLSAILALLLILISINYVLDFLRANRAQKYAQIS